MFVETIAHYSPTEPILYSINPDGKSSTESSFYTKMYQHQDRYFLFRIESSLLVILNLNQQKVFDFKECLLETIQIVDLQDQLCVVVMSNQGTIFRIIIGDWESLQQDGVDQFHPFLFQQKIPPVTFHCVDQDSIIVSLVNGQLYLIHHPLDSDHYEEKELKDSSVMSQFKSIVNTPVKFINAIRNTTKARITGLEDQAISMTTLHYESIHHTFTLTRNGTLTIWNILARTCVTSCTLERLLYSYPHSDLSEIFSSSHQKCLDIFSIVSTNQFVGGRLLIHLPFSYQPVFVIADFTISLTGSAAQVLPIAFIPGKPHTGQLLDFLVKPVPSDSLVQEFTLWALWENKEAAIQYATVSLGEMNTSHKIVHHRWFQCQSTPEQHVSIFGNRTTESLDKLYIEFIFEPGRFSLQSIAMVSEFHYSKEISINRLVEHVISFVASHMNGDADAQTTLSDSWHHFLSQLIEYDNSQMESVGLYDDKEHNRIRVLKRGSCFGFLRGADIVEVVESPDSLHILCPPTFFTDNLQGISNVGLRSDINHLRSLIGYVLQEMISTFFIQESHVDIVTGIRDLGIDEYSIQVYERIREGFSDNEQLWQDHLRNVELYSASIGSMDHVLESLLHLFQHSDYQNDMIEPNTDEFTCNFISKILKEVVTCRFIFIRDILFTLFLLKQLDIPIHLSRSTFTKWYSLYLCYLRLFWLVNQHYVKKQDGETAMIENLSIEQEYYPTTLLEFIIHRYISLPCNETTKWSFTMIEASISALAQLRWAIVYPIGSLEESGAIIGWASTLLKEIPAHQLLPLLELIPFETSAYCVLMGQIWLELNEYEKAKSNFLKGVSGIGNSDSDLGLVLQEHILQGGICSYYETIMTFCLDKNVLDVAVFFGTLAASSTVDTIVKTDILKRVFNIAISCYDFDVAYECVLLLTDPEQQRFCLDSLVGQLCDSNTLDLLCTRFSFAGMKKQVEDVLIFKARTEIAHINQESMYYKICYSYFTYRNNFKAASMVMYNHGRKLSELAWSSSYSVQDVKNVVTTMSQCFLASLNSLSILDKKDAYLIVPNSKKSAFQSDGDFPDDDGNDVTIVESEDVRKLYHLTLAKLILSSTVTHLGHSFAIPDPQDMYNIFCNQNNFDGAIQIANLYQFKLDKVIIATVRVISQIINGRPCTFVYDDEHIKSTGSLLTQSWETLKYILKRHDCPKKQYPYHQLAIQNLLQMYPDLNVPKWLLEPFHSSIADILIRLYLKHSRIVDAVKLLKEYLSNATSSTSHGHCSKWIPANTLDMVMMEVENRKMDAEKNILVTALAEYQAELTILSKI